MIKRNGVMLDRVTAVLKELVFEQHHLSLKDGEVIFSKFWEGELDEDDLVQLELKEEELKEVM